MSHGRSDGTHVDESRDTRTLWPFNRDWSQDLWVTTRQGMSHGTHMHASPVYMSHGTHVDESCHTHTRWSYSVLNSWNSESQHANVRVTAHMWTHQQYKRVMARVMAHIWMSRVTHELWVKTRECTSHGTHMNTSWHTRGWVTSDTHVVIVQRLISRSVSHDTHTVIAHTWMSHGACINEAWFTWVMAHIRASHVIHMNTSCHTHMQETYGVATISRLLKIIGLFCRISSLL